MPGANSKSGRGGSRQGAGRPSDIDLERCVVDLCVSLGYQGDARVNPDQVIDGKIVLGAPWSRETEREIRPESVRDAARMVARRRLADHALTPKARERMEASLAGKIRRAYYHAQRVVSHDESWREIEVGPGDGIPSVAIPDDGDEEI